MNVLDTTVAIDFLRGKKAAVSAVKSAVETSGPVALSTVSTFELLYPLHHRKLERQEAKARSFIRQTKLLSLDQEAAEESAKIMGRLLRVGEPVNALDVLIAGSALSNGAEKLLSADRDFERIAKVSELKVEMVGVPRP